MCDITKHGREITTKHRKYSNVPPMFLCGFDRNYLHLNESWTEEEIGEDIILLSLDL